jgi:hypothetical protein
MAILIIGLFIGAMVLIKKAGEKMREHEASQAKLRAEGNEDALVDNVGLDPN